jgi:hypothetical protein
MNIQPIKSHPHFRKKEESTFSRFLFDERYIFQEVPTLVLDGTNKKYKVSKKISNGTEMIFRNGMLMKKGTTSDYTISDEFITFTEVPGTSAVIVVNYKYE